ncbi:MAG: hypothetical protein UX45_C0021G0005 [Candidatus Uhrbacteria bacterium GW2011_GWF2_46_218]|uniref:Uncharacterized protein n=1 Tax=Candidatus Uhrbacteria bacterium GW2011_GWF2_46_218 TaxID=1619001 RepID=A0A0G1RQJ3_9BACT|nr:MAG: hypothetical protein UX45_C0021G0005 [Candidatus Uhrbacteria bacterium GW2011_GWF2_46_218]
MKTYRLKSAAEVQENSTNLWEAFVTYLDSVYFEGAAELLDKELVSFEYNAYISCYGS